MVIGAMTAALVWLCRWRTQRMPATLVGLVASTALYGALASLWPAAQPSGTVEALPGGVTRPHALKARTGIDAFGLPRRHSGFVFLTAILLALVGTIEALLAAVASDQLTGTRHDNRREFRALGWASIVSGLCGGLPLGLMSARAVL